MFSIPWPKKGFGESLLVEPCCDLISEDAGVLALILLGDVASVEPWRVKKPEDPKSTDAEFGDVCIEPFPKSGILEYGILDRLATLVDRGKSNEKLFTASLENDPILPDRGERPRVLCVESRFRYSLSSICNLST